MGHEGIIMSKLKIICPKCSGAGRQVNSWTGRLIYQCWECRHIWIKTIKTPLTDLAYGNKRKDIKIIPKKERRKIVRWPKERYYRVLRWEQKDRKEARK